MRPARCNSALFRSGRALALLTGGLIGAPAMAQSAGLRPVDQGYADVGPLSASQRVVPSDLRVPSGFDRVYRLSSNGKYARVNGGITAVFPRSQYVVTRDGYSAQTPAGTVYYIGHVPVSIAEQADALSGNGIVARPYFDDRSARAVSLDRARSAASTVRPASVASTNRAASEPKAAPVAAVSEPTTIFNDENYRARRVSELLDTALRASG